jgi:hypothetical protein
VLLWIYVILSSLQSTIFPEDGNDQTFNRLNITSDSSLHQQSPYDVTYALFNALAPYWKSWLLLGTLSPLFYVNNAHVRSNCLTWWALFLWVSSMLGYMRSSEMFDDNSFVNLVFSQRVDLDLVGPCRSRHGKAFCVILQYWSVVMLALLAIVGVLLFRALYFTKVDAGEKTKRMLRSHLKGLLRGTKKRIERGSTQSVEPRRAGEIKEAIESLPSEDSQDQQPLGRGALFLEVQKTIRPLFSEETHQECTEGVVIEGAILLTQFIEQRARAEALKRAKAREVQEPGGCGGSSWWEWIRRRTQAYGMSSNNYKPIDSYFNLPRFVDSVLHPRTI